MVKREYGGIDYFRVIAAILVVAIHTSPLSSVSMTADFFLTRIIARVAVPFFFMVTGFFIFSKQEKKQFSYSDFFVKIGKIYSISIVLYLPLNIYTGYFKGYNLFGNIVKDLVFNGTFYHLWYLPGIILGVGMALVLLKFFGFKNTFLISLILYIVGVFGDSYYGFIENLPVVNRFYHLLFQLFGYTRNGIFFSPIFILLGMLIFKRKEKLPFKLAITGFVCSLGLMFLEGWLIHVLMVARHDSMYFSLIPVMYFMFQVLFSLNIKNKKSLRAIPLYVYIIHPWSIVLVRGIGKVLSIEKQLIENSLIHFIVVLVVSFVTAYLVYIFLKKKRLKNYKKGRAWCEVNLSNLRHNYQALKNVLPQDCDIMGVVKADAYGHGDVLIASALQKEGVQNFAVASLREGIKLRKKGIKGKILILGYTYPKEFNKLKKYNLIQTVVDCQYAKALNDYGKRIKVHIKIDTGMNRLGEDFANTEEIIKIFKFSNLEVEGMYTHLCVSDSLLDKDILFSLDQMGRFYNVIETLKTAGHSPKNIHIQSSYGVLNYPELHCQYARVGIALYGMLSSESDQTRVKIALKPVLSVKARVSIVKEIKANKNIGYGGQFTTKESGKIATLTIGYADGIPRNLTDGKVMIKGKQVPIVGSICMDQITIDVTNIAGVQQGDVVTLIGQVNGEKITGEEVARKAGTITNELFSRLGSRLERVYHY
ncbi:serine/alanine racemase [Natranaerovirga hydrolytica]|uniref:Alanine racemase n=1 Tax=Natranaerovirga hydrolytica TaxID=680378 RepID=A0A4R1N1Y9_9FIRM|nr:serine racemase VanT catalytic subunit [Natranaerovirga hydrolytica]TCK98014.1 serine/alanine racemase [Natranaerovirga hydrolytica]